MVSRPTLRDVYAARRAVAGIVRRTPLVESDALSEGAGAGPVFLKLENLQVTGAFKARGATNALASLDAGARERGVIAVSTGNHGRAVATAARRLGVKATVCVSERVPEDKIAALRATGCELVIAGDSQDDAEVRARELVEERGLTLVHPFDDPAVIAGQGTIGLEILEDLPGVRRAVVPLSGGGLMAGVALALKSADPELRVVGVSMERGAAMARSLRAGRPVPTPEEPTLADSLQGG
ncbi:MAG: pyridoxal-phosphate dependent enzyme, partial [Deinococcales bacterium]